MGGGVEGECEVRVRGLQSRAVGEESGFGDGEASYRLGDGGTPNEVLAGGTGGYRPEAGFLLMVQSLNTISDGAGQGIFDEYRYHNMQVSGVLTVSQSVSLQAGLVGTIAGENALRERGFFGGLWVSF